jgi:hypothetical protein
VKVEPKWRQSRSLLAEFGYRTEEWCGEVGCGVWVVGCGEKLFSVISKQ